MAMLVPSGMFWSAIARKTKEAEALAIRRPGRADRESLGETVREEDEEDEQSTASACASKPGWADLMCRQPAPDEKQEAHSDCNPRDHRAWLVLVERGQEEAHHGGDAHEPDREPPEEGAEVRNPVAQEEDRNRSKAGGEGREDADDRYDDDFRHARPYPV